MWLVVRQICYSLGKRVAIIKKKLFLVILSNYLPIFQYFPESNTIEIRSHPLSQKPDKALISLQNLSLSFLDSSPSSIDQKSHIFRVKKIVSDIFVSLFEVFTQARNAFGAQIYSLNSAEMANEFDWRSQIEIFFLLFSSNNIFVRPDATAMTIEHRK